MNPKIHGQKMISPCIDDAINDWINLSVAPKITIAPIPIPNIGSASIIILIVTIALSNAGPFT